MQTPYIKALDCRTNKFISLSILYYTNLLVSLPLLDGLVAPAGVILGDHLQRELLGLSGAQCSRGDSVNDEPGVQLIAGFESRESIAVRFGDAVLEFLWSRCGPGFNGVVKFQLIIM